MKAIHRLSSGQVWPVDVRWREERRGRSRRLAQPVRLGLTPGPLIVLLETVAGRAHVAEFRLTTAGGHERYVDAGELLRWARNPVGLPSEKPDPLWRADAGHMADVASAVESLRRALGRLVAVGVLTPGAAAGLTERLHVALASLPASALPLWRP